MAWEDLPRLELSRDSRLSLREKWKWGPCYDFEDDGLGFCMRCNWQHGGSPGIEFKRLMICVAIEKLKAGESTDLFAELVDVPAAIWWFLRWMEFSASMPGSLITKGVQS